MEISCLFNLVGCAMRIVRVTMPAKVLSAKFTSMSTTALMSDMSPTAESGSD
jgi:hypothetical protein